jgi:hypothetical protein
MWKIQSGEEYDALGSPIDSVGLMNDRLLMIEVKQKINGGHVNHAPGRSGSIEGKIARTVKGLHEGRSDAIWPAIRTAWQSGRPPVFVILAGTYSESGLRLLSDLCKGRSSEWLFDYRIWRWTGVEVVKLEESGISDLPHPDEYRRLCIPALREQSLRSPVPPVEYHRELAGKNGCAVIFDYLLKRASELNCSITPSGTTVRLRAAPLKGKRSKAISILPGTSSKGAGLHCGFFWDSDDIGEDRVPGAPAPKKGPLTRTNRYLRTIAEAEKALTMFAI